MKPLSLLLIFLLPVSIWGQNNCETSLGPGQLLCYESDDNGQADLFIRNGQNLRKISINNSGQIMSEIDLGTWATDSFIVTNNQIIKKLANGTEVYRKDIPQAILNQFPVLTAGAELENGNFVLAGFQKDISSTNDPLLSKDSLTILITDPNLNLINSIISQRNTNTPAIQKDSAIQILPLPNNEFTIFYFKRTQPFSFPALFDSLKLQRFNLNLQLMGQLSLAGDVLSLTRIPCGGDFSFSFRGSVFIQSPRDTRFGTYDYQFDAKSFLIKTFREDATLFGRISGTWFNYTRTKPDSINYTYGYQLGPIPPSIANIRLITGNTETEIPTVLRAATIIRTSPTNALVLSGNTNGLSMIDPVCENNSLGADLELRTLNVSNRNPDQWSNYNVTLQVVNRGPKPATGIEISIPVPDGSVLQGGNEYTASQGTYQVYNSFIWNVGDLDVNRSATITLNYFNRISSGQTVYAQVIDADENDADSTPNNGTPPNANEDDEVAVDINGGSSTTDLADLTPTLFEQADLPLIGGDIQARIHILNQGDATSGFYEYDLYFSEDDVLSNDDQLINTNGWTNTTPGSTAESTLPADLPANLAPGTYYLILSIDRLDRVEELDETNNLASFAFTIGASNCSGSITLSTQAEVDAFGSCTVYDGSITIQGADINNLQGLSSLEEVTGFLSIEENDILQNLNGLENLSSVRELVIRANPNLNSISALSNLSESPISIGIFANQNLSNLNGLNRIGSTGNLVILNNSSLENIQGLEGLMAVSGNIVIEQNPSLLNLGGLENITGTVNAIVVQNNSKLISLAGLVNIQEVTTNLFINNLDQLKNLFGLDRIIRVGLNLGITNNSSLLNVNALTNLNAVGGTLDLVNNSSIQSCCGIAPLLSGVNPPIANISNNPTGCSSISDLLNTCQAGNFIDLGLTINGSSPIVDIYQNYSFTITARNEGSVPATGIQIWLNQPSQTVYQGGNEFTASLGSFSPTTRIWHINNLPPQSEATLTINLFTLAISGNVTGFAQVGRANEDDSDSTPGNGACCVSNEDDEAVFTAVFGNTNTLPDLTLSNLDLGASSGKPGDIIDYSFDLNNIGNATASGNYLIEAYISTDNQFSTDDAFAGEVPTGNTPIGTISTIPGAITVPNLPDGNYFFILVTDVNEDIAESNENNNILVSNFTINDAVISCSGDITLTTQAEVDAFGPCNIYNGNITVNGFTITNLNSFSGLRQINGDLRLDDNNNLEDLSGLENLTTVTGYFEISDDFNGGLDDLSALSKLTTVGGAFDLRELPVKDLNGLQNLENVGSLIIHDLSQIKNLDELVKLNNIQNLLSIFSCDQLANINGLNQLTQLGNSLSIRANRALTTLAPLQNIRGNLNGYVSIWGNSSLNNLDGLEQITSIQQNLNIYNNWELQNIDGLRNISFIGNEFRLNSNRGLANCCGAYPLLANGTVNGNIFIDGNAACNSVDDILVNCAPQGGVDLELSLNGNGADIPIYNFTTVTMTISNTGTETATGIRANIGFTPGGVVFEGGNEAIVSKGTFVSPAGAWFINELAPGETATADVNFFLLTADPALIFAQVSLMDQPDIDSEPFSLSCSPTDCPTPEDDEDKWIINGSNNNIRSFSSTSSPTLTNRSIIIHKIYPNPVQDQARLEILAKEIYENIPLRLYNSYGQLLQERFIRISPGFNQIHLDVNDLPSGLYHVKIETGHRHQPIRLIKQRF